MAATVVSRESANLVEMRHFDFDFAASGRYGVAEVRLSESLITGKDGTNCLDVPMGSMLARGDSDNGLGT